MTKPERKRLVGASDSEAVAPSIFRAALGALYDWFGTAAGANIGVEPDQLSTNAQNDNKYQAVGSRTPSLLWEDSNGSTHVLIENLLGYDNQSQDIRGGFYFVEYLGVSSTPRSVCLQLLVGSNRSFESGGGGAYNEYIYWGPASARLGKGFGGYIASADTGAIQSDTDISILKISYLPF